MGRRIRTIADLEVEIVGGTVGVGVGVMIE